MPAVTEWVERWPDYGTLVFREPGEEEVELPDGLDPPYEHDETDDSVNGTLALTGLGWFHGNLLSSLSHPLVRVEVLDGPPPADLPPDADLVADLPYWSPTGSIRFNGLVPVAGGQEVDLDGPGGHTVRTACGPVPGEHGEAWLLQFWPVPVPEPPRWLRRNRVRPSADPADAEQAHGYLGRDLRSVLVWSPERRLRTTVGGLADRLRAEPDAVRGALAYLEGVRRGTVRGGAEGLELAG